MLGACLTKEEVDEFMREADVVGIFISGAKGDLKLNIPKDYIVGCNSQFL